MENERARVVSTVLGLLADPVPWLCVVLLGGAAGVLRRSRGVAAGLAMCCALVYALSVGPGNDLLLRPLEQAYPPLHDAPIESVEAVVVLTGGEGWSPERPITSALSTSSTDRLVEAIRVWHLLGEGPLLLMVGGIGTPGGRAEGPLMAQAARALGVPDDALAWESASRNTYENAQAVRAYLGDGSFVLVTSAFHMPRAMEIFERSGMAPIPAPCGHAARIVRSGWDWFPRAQALWRSAQALREHVARIWYRVRYGSADDLVVMNSQDD